MSIKTTQKMRVKAACLGTWRTLQEIALLSRMNFNKIDSEAAISARLREFKPTSDGVLKEKRLRKGYKNLWEYRLVALTEQKVA